MGLRRVRRILGEEQGEIEGIFSPVTREWGWWDGGMEEFRRAVESWN